MTTRRRIVIHLGLPKTGSTTIQSLLAANHDRLGEGIRVSAKDDLTYRLRKYALKYRRSGGFPWWKLRHEIALRRMVRRIDAMSFDTLIISDENLIGIESGRLFDSPERLRYDRWLAHLDAALSAYDVQYVVYQRDPKSWQRSAWNQAFKMRRVKTDFESWARDHSDLDAPRRLIEQFRALLGDRLHVIDMAEEIGENRLMGRRVLEVAGVLPEHIAGLVTPPRENESLPLAAVELLRLIHETGKIRRGQYRMLTRLFRAHPELFAPNSATARKDG